MLSDESSRASNNATSRRDQSAPAHRPTELSFSQLNQPQPLTNHNHNNTTSLDDDSSAHNSQAFGISGKAKHVAMPPPPIKGNRFVRDVPALSHGARRSQSASPFRLTMPFMTPGQLAFSAMQFLPVPVLVLDSLKTVVMANEAMGRLLGMGHDMNEEGEGMVSVMDQLRGQSLSQVGIDLLQAGGPVWVNWHDFLDQVASEMRVGDAREGVTSAGGDATPTLNSMPSPTQHPAGSAGSSSDTGDQGAAEAGKSAHRPTSNAVIEVVVSRRDISRTTFDTRARSRTGTFQAHAKMIISVWQIADNQSYFTLTFTSTDSVPNPQYTGRKFVARPNILEVAEKRSIFNVSNPPSLSSSNQDSRSPSFTMSPGAVTLSSSPFPPLGPPSKSSMSSTPSILQKIILMKDALLDNTTTPVLAMWKDGSVTFPNRASRELFNESADLDRPLDGFDLLPAWTCWTEDFTRLLDISEYPISVLIRTEKPFTGMRIGMCDRSGKRLVFDVEGSAIRDDHTGEFLAGVVTCRDVTRITEEISEIRAADEERFKLICDTMPQLVWTATPEGAHDFFNSRWYSYTGLSEKESIGLGWKNSFHPDDMAETERRWKCSLETGEQYVTEYRCRSKEGEWRWFLGRALPLRNKKTGEVEKWFGTCTDVNESIEAKLEAKRTRQQLLSVIAHSRMTMFTVDVNRRVTMIEGALIWDSDSHSDNHGSGSGRHIGENVYDVFNRLNSQLPEGQMPPFLKSLEPILRGEKCADLQEHEIEGRWYRTRFHPILGKKHPRGSVDGSIEGVIGLIMDVTELKSRQRDIEAQALEKQQLLANEAAAKEASRLKSQFLANMSHEIRTPITGVIGMAELLLDVELEEEPRELTKNIYSSANALLTVINDILDFSKVESGRLDIEEVQFSLSGVVRDMNNMLSFAAGRKNLDFRSHVFFDTEKDLFLMGDPGRVKQIITNLLTNSVKFTSQGYVKFSVLEEKETPETIEIKFVVEDTGIGIEEEVRKRLFQPFSQGDSSTARKFGGTGLGLTICKNLLDLMNGRMTLQSRLGAGTIATFWIPFNKPQDAQSAHLVSIGVLPDRLQSEMSVSCNSSEYEHILGSSSTDLTGHLLDKSKSHWRNPSLSLSAGSPEDDLPMPERTNIHVLVVEDNEINQQIAIKTIKKLGFQVTAAWNGKEAIEYLTAAKEGKQTKPDIILMDVQMPLIDGYKCTHLLRRHVPYKQYVQDIPIVAMTASAIQGDKEKCKRAGMDDYLSKPVKKGNLERMLVRWCTKKRLTVSPVRGSGLSDCSEMGETCSTAEIPGIDLEDEIMENNNTGKGMVPGQHGQHEGPAFDDKQHGLPTPRAGVYDNGATEGPCYFLSSPSEPKSDPMELDDMLHSPPVNRMVTDELAIQSRDDKLIDAAGGAATHSLSSPLPTGEALTEENVGRLVEESLRGRSGSGGRSS